MVGEREKKAAEILVVGAQLLTMPSTPGGFLYARSLLVGHVTVLAHGLFVVSVGEAPSEIQFFKVEKKAFVIKADSAKNVGTQEHAGAINVIGPHGPSAGREGANYVAGSEMPGNRQAGNISPASICLDGFRVVVVSDNASYDRTIRVRLRKIDQI